MVCVTQALRKRGEARSCCLGSGSSNGSACTIHCKLTLIQQEPSHSEQTCAAVVSYRSTHCLSQNMGQLNLGHKIRDNQTRKKCTLIINRLDRLCSGKQKTVESASHGVCVGLHTDADECVHRDNGMFFLSPTRPPQRKSVKEIRWCCLNRWKIRSRCHALDPTCSRKLG